MTEEQRNAELLTLAQRFSGHPERHREIRWEGVETRLSASDRGMEVLVRMEESGGEPDVIGRDDLTGELLFCDCSAETPVGRRGLCYDEEALRARKKSPPQGSALGQAKQMGVSLLTEEQYFALQKLGSFDLKTSSWISTPEELRAKGGALFCERRYGRTFVFHNGADSYYSVRGWRGLLRV